MTPLRPVSLTPADSETTRQLYEVRRVAMSLIDREWWSDGELLRLPRRRRLFSRREFIRAKRLIDDTNLTVWQTVDGETWWRYAVGSYSHTKTDKQVMELLPADIDIALANRITKSLTKLAFAA